jgi:hypothetical protein
MRHRHSGPYLQEARWVVMPRGQGIPVAVVEFTICIDHFTNSAFTERDSLMRKCITTVESEGRLR